MPRVFYTQAMLDEDRLSDGDRLDCIDPAGGPKTPVVVTLVPDGDPRANWLESDVGSPGYVKMLCRESLRALLDGIETDKRPDTDTVVFVDQPTMDCLRNPPPGTPFIVINMQESPSMRRLKATGYHDCCIFDGAVVSVVPGGDTRIGTAAVARFDRGGHPADASTIQP